MQIRPLTAIAALAAIGLNLTPGLAQADFDRAMTDRAPTESRILAAEIASFRDGVESVRPLPEALSGRVDEAYVSSGAVFADLSAHEYRMSAARSEGVILAMTDPTEMVEARLTGMLVAYEVIDARVRLDPEAPPEPVSARSVPSPQTLELLIDDRVGLPHGEAGLAGYERMMTAWAGLGTDPALAPIRTPAQELRFLQMIEEHPDRKGFLPTDLIALSAEERADRVRDLVRESPDLKEVAHGAVLDGSDLTQERTSRLVSWPSPERVAELSEVIAEDPRRRRFFHETVLEKIDAYQHVSPDPSP